MHAPYPPPTTFQALHTTKRKLTATPRHWLSRHSRDKKKAFEVSQATLLMVMASVSAAAADTRRRRRLPLQVGGGA